MVNIRDKMSELVKGIFRVKIEDDKEEIEFEIKPTEGHKADLLYLFKRQSERDIVFAGKAKKNQLVSADFTNRDTFNKEMYNEQSRVMKLVMKNSYPDMTDEEIVAILNKYDNPLFEELCIAYGWINKDVKEAQKKMVENELKKLSGEMETPQENSPQNNEQKKSEET